MKDSELQFDRNCHVLCSKPCKKEILAKIALHYPEARREAVWEQVQRLTDIMAALCNVDYASMELIHARLIRTTTCANGCKCDFTICGDRDPYLKDHPEYRDENGYRRNT